MFDAAQIFALPMYLTVAQKIFMMAPIFVTVGAVAVFLGRMEMVHGLIVAANGLLIGAPLSDSSALSAGNIAQTHNALLALALSGVASIAVAGIGAYIAYKLWTKADYIGVAAILGATSLVSAVFALYTAGVVVNAWI